MAGEVLAHIHDIVSNRRGSRIASSIRHKGSGGKQIGFRGTLQLTSDWRQKFVLTGFRYMPDPPETIGVMEKLVKVAQGEGRMILVYFDDRSFDGSLVFDPQAYADHGRRRAKNERRQRSGERWLNLPRGWGVELRTYADGRDEPRTTPPDPEPGEGGWFSV